MKNLLLVFLSVFLSAAAMAQTTKVIYTCPMHPEVQRPQPGKCPKCGMALVKKTIKSAAPRPAAPKKKAIPRPAAPAEKPGAKMDMAEQTEAPVVQADKKIIYTCPMHPEVRTDKPGNCPKCGMKLIPEKVQTPIKQQGNSSTYTCPMHPEIHSTEPGNCPKCGMKLVQEKSQAPVRKTTQTVTYTCPMHPEIHSPVPGNCPKCGMKLEKEKPAADTSHVDLQTGDMGMGDASQDNIATAKKKPGSR
jgi:ssDNA-binding Zn-finger/Zn-ribbon topoisomerase 1